MADFLAALGLVLVIEGLLYAAFPDAMKRAVSQLLVTPSGALRSIALLMAAVGLVIVWLVRGAGM